LLLERDDLRLERGLVRGQRGDLGLKAGHLAARFVAGGKDRLDGRHRRIGIGDVDGQPVDQHSLHGGLLLLQEVVEERLRGGGATRQSVTDRAFRSRPSAIHQCYVVAVDGGLLRDERLAFGIDAIRDHDLGAVAAAQLTLARLVIGNRRLVGDEAGHAGVFAIADNFTDRALCERGPVVDRHPVAGMVVRDRLGEKAAERTLSENLFGRPVDGIELIGLKPAPAR
jgi:hypothetical protein